LATPVPGINDIPHRFIRFCAWESASGTKQILILIPSMSAFGGKADISHTHSNVR